MGVHGSGADIDTLCVGPRHVTRQDFFEILYEMLKKETEITELSAVPDAYVPVIKFKFAGIEVKSFICRVRHAQTMLWSYAESILFHFKMDLLFAGLDKAMIPEDLDLLDESNLKNLEEKSVLSLNGTASFILQNLSPYCFLPPPNSFIHR